MLYKNELVIEQNNQPHSLRYDNYTVTKVKENTSNYHRKKELAFIKIKKLM